MTNRRFLAAAAALLAVALFLWSRGGDGEPSRAPGEGDAQVAAPGEGAGEAADSSRRAPRRSAAEALAEDEKAARYLQDQFGATIHDPRTQVQAIDKLAAYLQKHYPDDWQQRLRALLEQAFPGMGDRLMAQFANMQAYQEWLKANRAALNEMSRTERRDALRDARFRYFGGDADSIFAESLRNDRIYDAMDAINQQAGTSVGEKLETYVGAINESYGEEAPAFLESRQTELMSSFLELEAVQDDLHAMDAGTRAKQLDEVRKGMGLDEEARGRWRELDEQRDEAWEAGERYMEERGRIVDAYDGDEEARRLAELRGRHFAPEEADVIRSEEESGFFRFGHRRVYGKE